MKKHEQKYFTVFGPLGIMVIKSASIIGAAIRYAKKTGYKPDTVLPGHMIN